MPVLWLAGAGWDDPIGTDRRIVPELAAHRPVLWIDPARSFVGAPREYEPVPAPGVIRRTPLSLPGATRWGSRSVAVRRIDAVARALRAENGPLAATVLARPLSRFPRGVGGARILYATDDWIAGADLMGVSEAGVRNHLAAAIAQADAVVAVSPALLDSLAELGPRRDGVPWLVLPNGAPAVSTAEVVREPVAVLVGRLNDRLDLESLERTVAAGAPVRVVGRVAAQNRGFRARLERFLASDGVEWRGELPPEALPGELARAAVGLTPYADTAFNRSSFPLKTLDYLAAGTPVVSTDLSASRWFDSDQVRVAADADEFSMLVVAAIHAAADPARDAACRALATAHGWEHRADDMNRLIASLKPERSSLTSDRV